MFVCIGGGGGGGQTGLISTARLHLITLPSSTGPARSSQHTHTQSSAHPHTQCHWCHCHWQVPVIKTPSYHISNYTGNCRWNWKSFGWYCTSPSLCSCLFRSSSPTQRSLVRLWQKSVKGNDLKPIIGFRCTHSFFSPLWQNHFCSLLHLLCCSEALDSFHLSFVSSSTTKKWNA